MESKLNINKSIIATDYRSKRTPGWIGIIIHHTAVPDGLTSDSLWAKAYENIRSYLAKKDDNYVSAHFIIGREGEISQLVDPDRYEAFHAGVSSYWHPTFRKVVPDWNRYAIGIELVGDGNKHFYGEKQMESLISLCRELKDRYSIHPLCITGHENISYPRKQDPGARFQWNRLFAGIYVP